jgi:hypothetical protein
MTPLPAPRPVVFVTAGLSGTLRQIEGLEFA